MKYQTRFILLLPIAFSFSATGCEYEFNKVNVLNENETTDRAECQINEIQCVGESDYKKCTGGSWSSTINKCEEGARCNPTTKKCESQNDCNTNTECGDGKICWKNRCVECGDDADCDNNSECYRINCNLNNNCAEENICSIDDPPKTRCNNGQIETCECINGCCDYQPTNPDDKKTIQCKPETCEKNECSSDLSAAMKCHNSYYEISECGEGEVCDEFTAECVESADCQENEYQCDGTQLKKCAGNIWRIVNNNDSIDNKKNICCQKGIFTCKDNQPYICRLSTFSHQLVWRDNYSDNNGIRVDLKCEAPEICNPDATSIEDVCIEKCTDGEYRCGDSEEPLHYCDNGKWTPLNNCDSDDETCKSQFNTCSNCNKSEIETMVGNESGYKFRCNNAKIITSHNDLTSDFSGSDCIIFCGTIDLPDKYESISLNGISKVYGLESTKNPDNNATITSKIALTSPLFKDTGSVQKIKHLNLEFDVELSNNTHAALANTASDITVENVSYKGNLRQSIEDTFLNNIGVLFGELTLSQNESATTFSDLTIESTIEITYNKINPPELFCYECRYKNIGGLIGLVHPKIASELITLSIVHPKITKLEIILPQSASGISLASHIGGLIGSVKAFPFSKFIVNIESHDNSTLSQLEGISITNAERNIGGMIGYSNAASVNISNMGVSFDTLSSQLHCSAGLIGYLEGGTVNINNTSVTGNTLEAGANAAGLIGKYRSPQSITINNTTINIASITGNARNETLNSSNCSINDFCKSDGSYVAGVIGYIENAMDITLNNINSLISSIHSDNKYAGGIIGNLKNNKPQTTNSSEAYTITLTNTSNFVKNLTAESFAGGVIGSLEEIKTMDQSTTFNIENLQNYVSNLTTTKEPSIGGIIGGYENTEANKVLSLKDVVSYTKRTVDNNICNNRAITSLSKCNNLNLNNIFIYTYQNDELYCTDNENINDFNKTIYKGTIVPSYLCDYGNKILTDDSKTTWQCKEINIETNDSQSTLTWMPLFDTTICKDQSSTRCEISWPSSEEYGR